MTTVAVGVILPVHNEEQSLGAALAALEAALRHPRLGSTRRRVAVVLDACKDSSPTIARRWADGLGLRNIPVSAVTTATRAANVGAARAAGAALLLRDWHDIDPESIWLATTDADSQVPPEWLARQVAHHDDGIGIWTGTVDIADWTGRSAAVARTWQRDYATETLPLHGASLGVNASAYLQAGGFARLATGEDRALHRAVTANGTKACHDRSVPVLTSARRAARAPHGFAHALNMLEDHASPAGANN